MQALLDCGGCSHYLWRMHNSASSAARRLRFLIVAAAMSASAILAGGAEASAIEQDRNFVLRHGSVVDLQILDTRQRRRAFQDEQSRFRETDRRPGIEQPRQLMVPRLQRNCQLRPFGSTFLRSCR